jgi:integrase
MKISVVTESWLELKEKYLKSASITKYKYAVIKINKTFYDMDLESITESLVQKQICNWLQYHSLSTVKGFAVVLKMVLKYAIKNKIAVQPIDIHYPHVNSTTDNCKKIETFSNDEIQKLSNILLKSASNNKNLGILLVLNSGIRLGELCGIKLSDIDLNNNTITINRTIQRWYDFTNKKSMVITQSPKTYHSFREIPISSHILPLLRECKNNNDNSIFLASGTTKPLEPRNIQQYYKLLLKRNNIRYIKFHSLRHTFATRLIDKGANIKSVSEILGHATVNITLNLYVHPSLENKRKCIELLYQ